MSGFHFFSVNIFLKFNKRKKKQNSILFETAMSFYREYVYAPDPEQSASKTS
jgi:hypothetical protein